MKVVYKKYWHDHDIYFQVVSIDTCCECITLAMSKFDAICFPEGYDDRFSLNIRNYKNNQKYKAISINFCPFCGEKIEYVEEKGA